MKALLIFLSLIPLCQSSGFLHLKLTSDQDCLVHLEVGAIEYSRTVRLLAYETRSLEVSVPGVSDQLSVDFQILHHFSGDSLSEVSTQEFKLNNNGVWESRVIDSDRMILSIQSSFQCDNGFFGPVCERRSRSRFLQHPTSSVTSTVTPSSAKTPMGGFQISNNLIIYSSLALLVTLLIIANIILCLCRPNKSKYIDDTIPEAFQIVELVEPEGNSTYEYIDAPSRFLSVTTLESKV